MAINFYSDVHLAANKLGRDADNLLDFSTDNQITFRVGAGDGVIFKASGEIEATKFDGALEGNADTATLAATATHVTVTDNESTNENNLIPFIEDASATGNVGLESDGDFHYNPRTGLVTATAFGIGGHAIDDVDITAEFVDADAHIMSSKAIGARFSLKAGSTSITTLGTISTGVWNGDTIHSDYLHADTAHLTTAQTFTGAKTFGTTTKLQFRDANAYINSPSANDIEIAATTIVLDAANDIQLEQHTTVTGNLTVSGRNLSPSTSTNDFATAVFENDGSLAASATGNGRVLKYSPGDAASLTVGQIYFLGSDGIWAQADGDNVLKGSSQLLGVGIGAPRTVGVFMEGFISIPLSEILNVPGSGAVDGLPLYVASGSNPGHFDFTAPSGSADYVRIVGYAIDDTTGEEGAVLVYFDPSKDHILLA